MNGGSIDTIPYYPSAVSNRIQAFTLTDKQSRQIEPGTRPSM